MATGIVSGRVEESIKQRAAAHLLEAGITAGEAINRLWSYIAQTGTVPNFEKEDDLNTPFNTFMELREELSHQRIYSSLPNMNNDELHEYLAEERLKEYEALA